MAVNSQTDIKFFTMVKCVNRFRKEATISVLKGQGQKNLTTTTAKDDDDKATYINDDNVGN